MYTASGQLRQVEKFADGGDDECRGPPGPPGSQGPPGPQGPSGGGISDVWENIDYPGSDIGSSGVNNKDECKAKCVANPNCVGAIYSQNANNGKPYCWQKSELTNPVKNVNDRFVWEKNQGPFNKDDTGVILKNNNLKFSRNWSGYNDNKSDAAEISNDTKDFKTLMIVGNKAAGGPRRVSVWDKLEVNGQLCVGNNCVDQNTFNKGGGVGPDPKFNSVGRDGDDWFRIFGTGKNGTALYNGLSVNEGGGLAVGSWGKPPQGDITATGKITASTINIYKGDPGAMIQKQYGNDLGDRYGLGQFPNGQTKIYIASLHNPATVSLSLAKSDGSFDDILTIDNSRKTTAKGDMTVNGKLCIGDVCLSRDDLLNIKNKR